MTAEYDNMTVLVRLMRRTTTDDESEDSKKVLGLKKKVGHRRLNMSVKDAGTNKQKSV